MSIKEAEEYAVNMGFARNARYSGLSLEAANALNESMHENIKRVPALKNKMSFIGSSSEQRQIYTDSLYKKITEMDFGDVSKMTQDDKSKYAGAAVNIASKKLKMPRNTFAAHGDGPSFRDHGVDGIALNDMFWFNDSDIGDLKKRLPELVEKKFHPDHCDTIKSIIDHEVGHAIDKRATERVMGQISNQDEIIEMYRMIPFMGMRNGLSEYARKDIGEMVAEGWAEYVNSPEPRPIAKKIGDLIIKLHGGEE
jgi:hypothetical protein